jgi:hypothetical protein
MSLLEQAVAAHGGMERWNEVRKFSAHMSIDGALFARKGHPGALKDVTVEGHTRDQFLQMTGFIDPGKRSVFRPNHVAVESSGGEVLEQRDNPRASFAGHTDLTPWDDLHLAYFTGYANWNYLVTPFLMASPGFVVHEIEPWSEGDETWRRLVVEFPANIATHSTIQTLYFDARGLQRRIDYRAEIAGGACVAHYCWAHERCSGIVVPTARRALRIGTDGELITTPASVEIAISEVIFT